MTPGFWLTLGTVLAGAAGCWWVVTRTRLGAGQTSRGRARVEVDIEKAQQALDAEHRQQRLEHDPTENVVELRLDWAESDYSLQPADTSA